MALNFLNDAYFAGKVGIGTDSPSYKLDVNGNVQLQATLYVRTRIQGLNSGGSYSDLILNDLGANVGIGTTSPSRNLQVKGTANAAIAITAPTTGLAQLALGDTDDDNYAQIILDNSTNKLQIQNGGGGIVSNRGITLDSSENVGIGTTSPNRKLNVNGNVGINNQLLLDSANYGEHLAIRRGVYGYDTIVTGTRIDYSPTASTNTFKFLADLQTTGQLNVTGNAIVNGNVGIGITNPSGVLHIKKDNATAAFNIQGGLNSQTTAGTITSEINFRSNDGSTTGGIATAIKSVSEIYNGAHNGLAFYTGQQSRTPYLKQMLYFTAAGGLSFGDTNTAYGTAGQILKSNADASPTWIDGSAIPGVPAGSGANKQVTYWTGTDTIDGDNSFKYELDASNNTLLDLSSTGTQQIRFFDTSSTYTESMRLLRFDDKLIITYGDNANEEALTVVGTGSTAGNVGIGTTSPSEMLTVGDGSSHSTINIDKGVSSDGTLLFNKGGTSSAHIKHTIYEDLNIASGAGTLQFQTGTSNSTRMVIQASGNVGIGTTSPLVKLQVYGNPMPAAADAASVEDMLTLYRNGSSTVWAGGASLSLGRYSAGGSSPKSRLDFKLKAAAGSNTALPELTVMTMNSDGRVGIGTTSPAVALQVQRASESEIRATESTTGNHLSLYQQAGTSYLIAGKATGTATQNLQIYTGNSARMTILSDGNVGIGTTSPVYKLDVSSGSAVGARISTTGFTNLDLVSNRTGGNLGGLRFKQDIDTYQTGEFLGLHGGGFDWKVGNGTGGNAVIKMRLDSSGNLGIGTTSPGSILTVSGPSSNQFQIINSANNKSWRPNINGNDFYITESGVSNPFVIQAGGNVGIGTTSPNQKLDVEGNVVIPYASGYFMDTVGAGASNFIKTVNSFETVVGTDRGSAGFGVFGNSNIRLGFGTDYTTAQTKLTLNTNGLIQLNAYNLTNQTGTPTFLLGTDASGNVVKTLSTPSPITSQAASLYDLIPNGAFTTTYAFTSTAGTYAEVMSGNDVITAAGTYSVQMYVSDYAVGGTQYREYYSGVMSWNYPDNTNDDGIGAVSEIVLHRAGHAANSGITYLRTRETGAAESNELKLEIMCNKTYTGASNVVFKFVRLI